MQPTSTSKKLGLAALIPGAIGVVYGDLGTSPLYTLRQVFAGDQPVPPTDVNIFGVLSLIFWSLMFVVSLKYIVFVMRADNDGEGGIIALMALVLRYFKERQREYVVIMMLGILGASLFYGDSVITPAISVLSAMEGLEIAEPKLKPWILPLTTVVIVALFLFQRKGSAIVGKWFGPIMIFWFLVLAILGFCAIYNEPGILQAINPKYAIPFFIENKFLSFIAIGAIFLALTGAEALYADMGHFGKRPIRLAWFYIVLPSLVLNYFGQGALMLANPAASQNPFYLLSPDWFLYPMIILSTVATVIASQAVITGTYSMTQQAMRLGYLPRMTVMHTSEQTPGQIYMPVINWILFAAVIAIVWGFQTSDHLGAAYGIAVTGTMITTTILIFIVAPKLWNWRWWQVGLFITCFLTIDLSYLSANILKVANGGWLPLLIASIIFMIMLTWKAGTKMVAVRRLENAIPLKTFAHDVLQTPPERIRGTAIFFTADANYTPRALQFNLMHNKVLHERVIVLKVIIEDMPHMAVDKIIDLQMLEPNFYLLQVHYGFKDDINIPNTLANCPDLKFDLNDTSFFLGKELLVHGEHPRMARWRERLFFAMFRNSGSATSFFKIPCNRVVEFGTQIEF